MACLAEYQAGDSESTSDCRSAHAGYPLSPRKARGASAREREACSSRSAGLILALCIAAGILALCLLCGHFLPLPSTTRPAPRALELDLSSIVASSPPRRLLDYSEVASASWGSISVI